MQSAGDESGNRSSSSSPETPNSFPNVSFVFGPRASNITGTPGRSRAGASSTSSGPNTVDHLESLDELIVDNIIRNEQRGVNFLLDIKPRLAPVRLDMDSTANSPLATTGSPSVPPPPPSNSPPISMPPISMPPISMPPISIPPISIPPIIIPPAFTEPAAGSSTVRSRLSSSSSSSRLVVRLPPTTSSNSPLLSSLLSSAPYPSASNTSTPSSSQSTLASFRAPVVLPNLAQAAIERLKRKKEAEDEGTGSSSSSQDGNDFQPVKKKKRVEESSDASDDNEGQTCSICFEPWSNSGSHRIAALKCGHLFGLACIETWLKNSSNGKCPQCNAKAKKSDIRVIYVKSISVVDTTERDQALRELEEEKGLRIRASKDETQALLQHNLARAECDRLKEELETVKRQLENYSASGRKSASSSQEDGGREGSSAMGDVKEVVPPSTQNRQGKYFPLKTISISQKEGARVMAYDHVQNMLVVSKPSSNLLLPGYGLVKMSTVDLGSKEYVSIHSPVGIVRDVVFSPKRDGMVLTGATDKTAKLTSMHSNIVAQSFQAPSPVWACSWDQDDPNYLYLGLQNGVVQVYDMRNPSEHVTQLMRPDGRGCPITSLEFIPRSAASSLNCGGVLMGSLNGCVFWEKPYSSTAALNFTAHSLSSLPEGACTSLSFEPYTRHCLASFRPSRRSPQGKHILFQMHNVPTGKPFSCQPIQQFPDGTSHRFLSRSRLFLRPGSDARLLTVFGDEATKSVHVWDVSTTLKHQHLSLGRDPALDILPLGFGGCGSSASSSTSPPAGDDYLAVLNQSKLFIYRWQWV